jgi:hypothetical protein
MDTDTALKLERCEARLRAAKGLLSKDDRVGAKRAFSEAHTLAREAVDAGGGQVTIPASLSALKRWRSRPRGYWRET